MKYPSKHIQTGINNPILRSVSEYIEEIDEELKDFCDTLMTMMRKHDGVGLAAPQIGQNIRAIATSQWKNKSKEKKII
jgi:peptide deformylase